ncbi:MAG: ureidoglycolate lyase [Leptolyngbyaceae cyanobacterium]
MPAMSDLPSVRSLPTQILTPEAFAPFGQVIGPSVDGAAYGVDDAQLELSQGIPRFYIMKLEARGRHFTHITRHQACTQCLGSLHGQEWLMAVAPPGPNDKPDPEKITAFRIPGDRFIKLEVGTWHAGPYFDQPVVDFYNLELSDTNVVDHHTCNLKTAFGLEFEIA